MGKGEKDKNKKNAPEDTLWDDYVADVTPLKDKPKLADDGVDAFDTPSEPQENRPQAFKEADLFEAYMEGNVSLEDLPAQSKREKTFPDGVGGGHYKLEQEPQQQPEKKTLFEQVSQFFNPPEKPSNEFIIQENSPQMLFGWRGGVDKKTLKNLKTGKTRPTQTLDLHGYYLLEAYTELRTFLSQAQSQNHRCVLVIHGKGGRGNEEMGVIKQNMASFLAEQPEVLAFCTAQPKHGGSGACYVLVRRHKK